MVNGYRNTQLFRIYGKRGFCIWWPCARRVKSVWGSKRGSVNEVKHVPEIHEHFRPLAKTQYKLEDFTIFKCLQKQPYHLNRNSHSSQASFLLTKGGFFGILVENKYKIGPFST